MDKLIQALEAFIEQKIAAEAQCAGDGYVGQWTKERLDNSRNELRDMLAAWAHGGQHR